MAKKQLFVTLQTPSILLPITAKDGAGTSATIHVRFKRYDIEEAQKKLNDYSSIFTEKENVDENLKSFLYKEIIGFENVSLPIYEEDENGEFTIEKGKITVKNSQKENATDYWDNAKECKDVIFNLLVKSQVWSEKLIGALFTSLTNREQKEAELGN